ncbi:hypothetical protein GCM10007977_095670 [Dactylosporangium sucinum]|uniref:Uncharacterized protein n=2 Tax=Dactylosporangium sucinum TaxID=1424081 RepID=A0A917UBU9_9ACTN|nr:hypothetical protein GCM10007977_095670 [Dactylosporangium sucinum]
MDWRRARRRIGRDEAERLLDGATEPGHEQLAALLRAAAGPARPHELAGEDAAVAAFRQGGRTAHAAARVRVGRRVGVLAGSLAAAVLLGGAATAAGAGRLPEPLQRAAHDWFAGVGVPEPDAGPVPPAPPRSAPPATSSSPPGVAAATTAPASPSAARIDELCRRWQEGRGRKLTEAELRELAAVAQGEERIEPYCKERRGANPGNNGNGNNGNNGKSASSQGNNGKNGNNGNNGNPGGKAEQQPRTSPKPNQ